MASVEWSDSVGAGLRPAAAPAVQPRPAPPRSPPPPPGLPPLRLLPPGGDPSGADQHNLLLRAATRSPRQGITYEHRHHTKQRLSPESRCWLALQTRWPDAVAPLHPRFISFVSALLHCEPAALRLVGRDKFIAKHGRGGGCDPGSPVLVKTIRLTAAHARALLAADPALRVIHLTRDPRALLASVFRAAKNWGAQLRDGNGTAICRNMRANSAAFRHMQAIGTIQPGRLLGSILKHHYHVLIFL